MDKISGESKMPLIQRYRVFALASLFSPLAIFPIIFHLKAVTESNNVVGNSNVPVNLIYGIVGITLLISLFAFKIVNFFFSLKGSQTFNPGNFGDSKDAFLFYREVSCIVLSIVPSFFSVIAYIVMGNMNIVYALISFSIINGVIKYRGGFHRISANQNQRT